MKQNEIVVIFGRKGSGKTTLTKEMLSCLSRFFVLDTLFEYDDSGVIFYTALDIIAYIKEYKIDTDLKKPFQIVCRFYDDQDKQALFDIAWTIGNCFLVIEEIDLYATPTSIDDPIYDLINYGRHRGLSLITIARRPHSVSRTLTAQADLVISFCQTEPRDITYLSEIFGSEAEDLSILPDFRIKVFGATSNPCFDSILKSKSFTSSENEEPEEVTDEFSENKNLDKEEEVD